ncbi:MAG: HNH endonuclease, partial [Bacteroidales bacterium]|nr:HNH endonuclease [Bacteroidales bacterium]
AGYYNLSSEEKQQFMDYPLQVYVCKKGTDKERLDWFRIINIAGERLTEQELRNAIYTGSWVTSAKQRFSKTNCVAKGLADNLMSGKPIRQDYLETVLRWIADCDGFGGKDAIENYMSKHQHDKNADREWQYFQMVVSWVRSVFVNYRSEMKGLQWGLLYNRYKDLPLLATDLEEEITRLMIDDDVTNKKGIYEYVLSGDERHLSIRTFSDSMKRSAYDAQGGICPKCGKHFEIKEMQADHITPWSKGGRTIAENCQMLCADCNRKKSDI